MVGRPSTKTIAGPRAKQRKARAAGANLFAVTLPTVVIPNLSAETERFT
jgi:hypothetical protein